MLVVTDARAGRSPANVPDDESGELMAWLLARLDEDEQVAKAATPGPWHSSEFYPEAASIEAPSRNVANESSTGDITMQDGAHIARWDPARVLAEVEAKRGIIGEYEDMLRAGASREALDAMETAIEYLALPYQDRPEYRDEWRP